MVYFKALKKSALSDLGNPGLAKISCATPSHNPEFSGLPIKSHISLSPPIIAKDRMQMRHIKSLPAYFPDSV
jgi:hypothetical protein